MKLVKQAFVSVREEAFIDLLFDGGARFIFLIVFSQKPNDAALELRILHVAACAQLGLSCGHLTEQVLWHLVEMQQMRRGVGREASDRTGTSPQPLAKLVVIHRLDLS